MEQFNGVKLFSATKMADREVLGDKVTGWLREKQRSPDFKIIDMRVTQSSDSEFHCVAMTVFYFEPLTTKR